MPVCCADGAGRTGRGSCTQALTLSCVAVPQLPPCETSQLTPHRSHPPVLDSTIQVLIKHDKIRLASGLKCKQLQGIAVEKKKEKKSKAYTCHLSHGIGFRGTKVQQHRKIEGEREGNPKRGKDIGENVMAGEGHRKKLCVLRLWHFCQAVADTIRTWSDAAACTALLENE